MFRLRRYFSIASLIAFLLVTVLLGMLYRSVALRMFVQLEENKNVELTQSFANSLWPEVQPLIALTENSNHQDIRNMPIVDELRQAVIMQMRGLSVVKIKVYDLDGHTIFSTQVDQIGEDGSANEGFQGALRGEIASELTHRDTFSAFESIIENQDVLSTYIPIHENGPATPVVGVFELYSNVTPFLREINATQRLLIVGVSIALILLYLVLLLIVSRADRIMRHQHAAQLAASEEIRRQQRAVAVLQEREHLAREIHDSLGQVLGYVNTQAQAARSLLGKEKFSETDRLLERLVTVAQDSHVDLRKFILELQTGELDEPAFLPRLEAHIEQFRRYSELRTDLHVAAACTKIHLPNAIGSHVFRIVQEALNNVHKHARATQVTVSIDFVDSMLIIAVGDNGRGFESGTGAPLKAGHWGIQNMKNRAAEIGASIDIQSATGKGTTITLYVPQAGGLQQLHSSPHSSPQPSHEAMERPLTPPWIGTSFSTTANVSTNSRSYTSL